MKDTNIVYWLFLQEVLGFGSNKILDVNNKYQDIREFYESDIAEIKAMRVLSEKQLQKFQNKSLDKYYKIVEKSERLGHYIITPDDERYPNRLKNIVNPPAALFVKGTFPDVDDQVMIAVVGARRCTDYGKSIARELAYNLATAGCIIVSGVARGIDYSAHTGVLRAKGDSIAVYPCGLNYPYLPENADLLDEVSNNGCLISELPPDTPVLKNAFQIRNRLISALSLGTVVVEGNHRSGARITANHALEQGKDIFAVPGAINAPMSAYPNELIRDGAIPVVKTFDILYEYNSLYPHRLNLNNCKNELIGSPETLIDSQITEFKEEKPELNISENAKLILEAFSDTEESFDDLVIRSGLDSSSALAALSELEISGVVESMPACRYSVKEY